MNKKELKAYLDKMNKTKLEDLIMGIHAQYPRVRDFIYDTVNPPAIDWEQLYKECRNYVIEASTSNKMGRIAVPAAALDKFTQYGPERDIAIAYIYETFDILVRGLLSLRFVDVKTAYLSHRQNFFWDTMPVITLDLCGAPGGDDRLPTKIRQRS